MSTSRTLILASGSLRGLICTAMAVSSTEPAKLALFHIRDGRPNAGVRRAHARKQAEHFKISRLTELEMPSIQSTQNTQNTQPGESDPPDLLVRPQIFLAAMAYAVQTGFDRILWPAQFDGDHQLIARTTEQTLLIEHLAQIEQQRVPKVELPILDLTDAQLIELGGQLDVPWELAWSCQSQLPRPCLSCAACVRRRQAFHDAGMTDPIDTPPPGSAPAPGSAPGNASGSTSGSQAASGRGAGHKSSAGGVAGKAGVGRADSSAKS